MSLVLPLSMDETIVETDLEDFNDLQFSFHDKGVIFAVVGLLLLKRERHGRFREAGRPQRQTRHDGADVTQRTQHSSATRRYRP